MVSALFGFEFHGLAIYRLIDLSVLVWFGFEFYSLTVSAYVVWFLGFKVLVFKSFEGLKVYRFDLVLIYSKIFINGLV